MMSKPQNSDPKLFYHGFSLESRLPQEHVLRRIKQLVDFNFIRSRVEHFYGVNGNVSIDPTVIIKLMFLLFYENIKSERALMEQLPLRLDWLWFCGYDLDDHTPDHSVISKARSRWGVDIFAEFFANILSQCIDAGLVDGTTIHLDSSMIDGNVSKDTLKPQLRMLGQKLYNDLETQSQPTSSECSDNDHGNSNDKPLEQCISDTDPDARMGKKYGKSTLGYKDHRVVDDKCGIVTATITTPANVNDAKLLAETIQTHRQNTDSNVKTIVTDKAYGNAENYKYLKENSITPCVPHQKHYSKEDIDFAHGAFRYDEHNDCYICPAQKQLRRYDHDKPYLNNSYRYRAKREVCEQCQFFEKCVSSKKYGRQINRNLDAEYIDWADSALSNSMRRRLMARRRVKAEGSFADAANNHGFKRARWRGLAKMKIQNLIIAAIQNLRKLMRHLHRYGTGAAAIVVLKTCVFELQTMMVNPMAYILRSKCISL
jgi:transposase